MIADDHVFNLSRPVHQQSDLAVYLRGNGAKRARQIAADYFIGGNVFSGQFFKDAKLFCFKARCITGYSSNKDTPEKNRFSTWR